MSHSKTEKARIFTKDYILICLVTTFLRMPMMVLMTVQPLYVIELNYTKTQAGLLLTIFTIAALVFRPFMGRLIDRYGRKKMLFIGSILYIIAMLPFVFTIDFRIFCVAQAFVGAGFSIYSVVLPTMITDIVPESKLTSGLGYYGLTATLVQALGPTVALILVNNIGYSRSFLVAVLSCLPALVMYFFIKYETGQNAQVAVMEEKVEEKLPFWQTLIEKNALGPSAYTFLFAIIMATMTAFLVPYANEAGIAGIGLFFTFRAIGTAISRAFVGPLSKKIKNEVLIGLSIVGIVSGTAGIFLFTDIVPLMAVAFISGLAFGMLTVLNNVAAVKNTPPKRRPAANATFYLAIDAGMGIGSTMWGVLADATGLRNIFGEATIMGVLIFVAFIVINILAKRKTQAIDAKKMESDITA